MIENDRQEWFPKTGTIKSREGTPKISDHEMIQAPAGSDKGHIYYGDKTPCTRGNNLSDRLETTWYRYGQCNNNLNIIYRLYTLRYDSMFSPTPRVSFL
ncbi:unnamed protein product [Nezara viridula]|uniref:Uncharacterized protein n=1 Tax=Nezara viridula TaxID=85310 RepID=A0A9P0E410_NEZVI|nr:unnamed protein product [Nezara viridula]